MQILQNVPLAQYTSLRVGGAADKLIKLEKGDDLKETIAKADIPIWVLGFGTNALISDKGLPGTAILNQLGDVELLNDGKIRADSGANWDELIQTAVAHNLWGLEFTSGVPGGVGAAVVGNIAAYGHKLSDCFLEAEILNLKDNSVQTWHKDDFDFNYRSSKLQSSDNKDLIVLHVTLQLSSNSTGDLEYESALKTARNLNLELNTLGNRRKIIMETRRKAGSLLTDNQTGPWTAGSFFKNPFASEEQVQAIIAHEEFFDQARGFATTKYHSRR